MPKNDKKEKMIAKPIRLRELSWPIIIGIVNSWVMMLLWILSIAVTIAGKT